MTVAVRRSSLRMWLLAMAGIPFLVIGLDVVTNRRITDALRAKLFRPEDTQIFEPRDEIWAWAMVAFGAFLVIWGLKELFVPTSVIEARPEALVLKLSGPLGSPSACPGSGHRHDVKTVEDDGKKLALLASRDDASCSPPTRGGVDRRPRDRDLTEDWRQPADGRQTSADYAVENAIIPVGAASEEE